MAEIDGKEEPVAQDLSKGARHRLKLVKPGQELRLTELTAGSSRARTIPATE